MSELEDKLNKILSSPADMEKIMGIARSLSGSMGGDAGVSDGAPSTQAVSSGLGSLDLSALSSTLGNLDPKVFRLMNRLVSEYGSGKNDKAELLNAIKPYLKEDRRAKVDRAVEIAKLAKLAKVAFAEFTGGDKV
jgi:hypothetical protein